MDRLDAMRAFVVAVDEGSLAAAARRLGRSPAAITRAIAALEEMVGMRLLNRTTHASHPTEAGERWSVSCRRILAEFDEGRALAADERAVPRGLLTVTAPAVFGRLHVRPVLDAFLDRHPAVSARLLLLDRVVDLVDEGIDVAVRIGRLPDSTLIARKVGEVRRVVCASPSFLAGRPAIEAPEDLAEVPAIVCEPLSDGRDWRFSGKTGPRRVEIRPRLSVNGAEAAVESAVEGHGVTRVLSYQIAADVTAGRLVTLLEAHEPPAEPVHLVHAEARFAAAKVRAFVDFAASRLR
ncbi:MAG: LysR family transcriptional regulator, partial [Phyllobacteriaceae bacterium]|nr:LysR family transcriptional regulator [Phyllobacteriaceae bacterium]